MSRTSNAKKLEELHELPNELIGRILNYADYESMWAVHHVTKKWQEEGLELKYWKREVNINASKNFDAIIPFLQTVGCERVVLYHIGEDVGRSINGAKLNDFFKRMANWLISVQLHESLNVLDEDLKQAFTNRLPHLRRLIIHEGDFKNSTFSAIAGHCPSLQIFISGGSFVSGYTVEYMGKNMLSLRVLDLGNCKLLGDDEAEMIKQNMHLLEEVCLQYAKITDDGALSLAGIKRLEKISLENCSLLTLDAVDMLAKAKKLTSLRLFVVKDPADTLCERIAEKMKLSLSHIALGSFNKPMSNYGLSKIAEKHDRQSIINIEIMGGSSFTPHGIQDVTRRLPNLKKLIVNQTAVPIERADTS